jgi:hypothetical protein
MERAKSECPGDVTDERESKMMKTAFLTLVVLFMFIWGCHTTFGQPPPLGPPTYKSDTHDLSVSLITNLVRTTVQTAVDNANTQIHKQHQSISVTLSSLTTNVPYRTPTQYTDRPNQWYVDVLMGITLNVSIPATSDRTISISLDVNAFCDGWQTGKGSLKIVATPGAPYVEGGNIVEEILGIENSINADIKSHLAAISAITTSLPGQCVSIGANVPPDHNAANSAIVFDPPSPRRPIISDPGESVLNPNLVVTFLRLKRLAARGNGAVLYYPTENIQLSTYANFDYRQANLTMKEGDDVALTLTPVTLQPPLLDSLVVIANIAQGQSLQPEDSSWNTSLASASFSPGVHTIQINKHYTIPPGLGNTKPIQGTVAAYELTYNVSYAKPANNRARAQ